MWEIHKTGCTYGKNLCCIIYTRDHGKTGELLFMHLGPPTQGPVSVWCVSPASGDRDG